jgi:diguanylate cyclase (GGDEF)-like protein
MTFDELYDLTGPLRVLYVEDEEEIRNATASLLENYIDHIDTAEDGQDGLNRYIESVEKEAPYDLVISDINMPFMNGIEMVEKIKEIDHEQTVLFLSAHNEQEFFLDAIKLGVSYYLVKPVQVDELEKILGYIANIIRSRKKVAVMEAEEQRVRHRTENLRQALIEWANVDFDEMEKSVLKATEISARALDVERVSIWLFDEYDNAIICQDLYEATTKSHSKGMELKQELYPLYFDAVRQKKVIAANDARSDQRTSEFREKYLEPNKIMSMLDIPILQDDHLIGVVCIETVGQQRDWSIQEIDFASSISSNLALSIEIKKRHEMQEKLRFQKEMFDYQAHHDTLTGLPNRTLFIDRLQQSIRHNQRSGTQMALLFIDLDRFKQINDSFGHYAGDQVLQIVAQRLSSQVRNVDTLARLGGDEFTLIIDELDSTKIVVDIIQKLLSCTEEPIVIEGHELFITLSIGVTIFPYDATTADVLLKNADSAMYKAKSEGRNTYEYYTPEMTVKAMERVKMESSLRRAIERDELVVYYQPQYNTATEQLIGMEALVRWNHPEAGMTPPSEFIPLAEETGIIIELDRWMMVHALKQFSEWYNEGLNPGTLSLNLAMHQIENSSCIGFIEEHLEASSLPKGRLKFEVTESRIMHKPEQAIESLRMMKSKGIGVAIDDFGTGYSSLAYLKRLPIDTLKIDRAFITGLPESEEDTAISNAIIALAKSLNLDVVAEGVETVEQKASLLGMGCEKIQGYLYAKPMAADDIRRLLEKVSRA